MPGTMLGMSVSANKVELVASLDADGVTQGAQKAVSAVEQIGDAGLRSGQDYQQLAAIMQRGSTAIVAAVERVSTQMDKLGTRTRKSQEDSEKAVDQTSKGIIAAIQRQLAQMEAGTAGTEKYYRALARIQGENADLPGWLNRLSQAEAAHGQSMRNMGVSAGQTAAAMRMLPAQITDITTSLVSGMPIWMVAVQQGGQIKDSFGGIGPAIKAIVSTISPLSLGLGVAATAIGVTAAAYYQGSKEVDSYRESIVMSGNAAGVTVSQLQSMAQAVAQNTSTQREAAAVLARMAGESAIARENFEQFATTAVSLNQRVGIATDDTVKRFVELGESPVAASIKLNEQYRYLTAEVFEQISALEQQGRVQEAGELAQQAFGQAMDRRTATLTANLGTIERAWESLRGKAAQTWDAMLGIGRAQTPADKIKEIDQEIAGITGKTFTDSDGRQKIRIKAGSDFGNISRLKELQDERAIQQDILDVERKKAEAQANEVERTAWVIEGQKYLTSEKRKQQILRAAEVEGQALLEKGLITQTQLTERIAAIKASQTSKSGNGSGEANANQREIATLQSRIAAEQELALRLQDRGAAALNLTEGERQVLQLQEQIAGGLKGTALAHKERALALAEEWAALQKSNVIEREAIASRERFAASAESQISATYSAAQSMHAQAAVLGKSRLETEALKLANAELALQMAKTGEVGPVTPEHILLLERAVAAQKKLTEAAAEVDYSQTHRDHEAAIKATDRQAALLKTEATLIGRTGAERQKILALREIELELAAQIQKIEENTALTAEERATRVVEVHQRAAAESANVITQTTIAGWDEVIGSMVDAGQDVFRSLATEGESAWKRIGKSLKESVIDLLYQMTVKQWIIQIGASIANSGIGGIIGNALGIGGGVGGAGGQGGGGIMQLLGGRGGLGNMLSFAPGSGGFGGAIGSFQAGMAGGWQGFTGGISMMQGGEWLAGGMQALGAAAPYIGALFQLGRGNYGSAAGMAAGAYIGSVVPVIGTAIGAMIGGLLGSFADFKKSPHMGAVGHYQTGHGSENYAAGVQDYNADIGEGTETLAKGIGESLEEFMKAFDLDGKIDVMTHWADDFNGKGRSWGNLQIQMQDAAGEWVDIVNWAAEDWDSKWSPREFTEGSAGWDEYVLEVYRSFVEGVQKLDLPEYIQNELANIDTDSASIEEINAALARVGAIQATIEGWSEAITGFADYGAAAMTQLIEAAGGFENLAAAVGNYYQLFYSDEERRKLATKQLTEQLKEHNVELPASKEKWRELVEQTLDAGEEGSELAALLLKLSGAFYEVADATERAKAAADDLAKREAEAERDRQIGLTGLNADALWQGIMDQINGGTAQNVGAYLAQSVLGGIENAVYSNAGQMITQSIITGVVQPVVAAAITGSLMSEAVSDAAIDAIIAKAEVTLEALGALLNSEAWANMMARIGVIMEQFGEKISTTIPPMRTVTSTITTVGVAAGNAASSLNSSANGLSSVANEWERLINRMRETVTGLRSDLAGDRQEGIAYYEAKFAVASAAARAGDKEAAEQLPELAKTLADLIASNGTSRLDVQRQQAVIAQSLENTAKLLADKFNVKIPGFATGGNHLGGLRIVGENGPELEFTGASRIMSNEQLQDLLTAPAPSNYSADSLNGLRGDLIGGFKALNKTMIAISRRLDDWDMRGMPTERKVGVAA